MPVAAQKNAHESGPGARPPAVCLLSGGMDSAVCLAQATADGFAPHALSFRYGQRHAIELDAAQRVAVELGAAEHRIVDLDLSGLSSSSLVGAAEVEKDRSDEDLSARIPNTYVPARNTVFLSVALGWAEGLGARDLYLGVNAVDYSGYPDCRPGFLAAFEDLASAATVAGAERGERFRVRAPLLELSKAQIVERAEALGVDLGLTHTCYDPLIQDTDGRVLACGRCDACRLRRAGFDAAGRVDPVPYV